MQKFMEKCWGIPACRLFFRSVLCHPPPPERTPRRSTRPPFSSVIIVITPSHELGTTLKDATFLSENRTLARALFPQQHGRPSFPRKIRVKYSPRECKKKGRRSLLTTERVAKWHNDSPGVKCRSTIFLLFFREKK